MTDLDPASQAPPADPPMTDAEWTPFAQALGIDDSTPDEPAVDSRLSVDRSSPSITPHEIIRRIGLPVVERDGRHICPVCSLGFEHAQALGPHFRLHWQEAGVALKDIPSVSDGRARCPECETLLIRHSLSGHLKSKHGYENGRANGVARIYGFDLDAYLNPPPPPKPEPKASKPKPNKPNYEARQLQFVVCPFGECGAVHKRKYMYRHLEAVHGIAKQAARDQVRELPASRHTKSIQSKLPVFGRPSQSKALAAVQNDSVEPDAVTPPPSDNAFAEAASAFDFTAISPNDIAIGVVQSQLNGTMPTALLPDVIDYVEHTRGIITKLRDSRT